MAQLGWIAGSLVMLFFAFITFVSAFLLCDCYRSPDPESGPKRNRSYIQAVQTYLGERSGWLCILVVQISLYGTGIAYTITSATSMRAIQKSNCYHKYGHDAACEFGDISYMLLFGVVQIVMSQIPDFHNMEWLSIVAAIMSFTYAFIGFALGFAKVIGDGVIKGSIGGVPVSTTAQKVWLVSQALGDIAFAYPYSIILIEIQDTLKSPPPENETMKKASTIAIFGGYQVYCQPLFAVVDKWFAEKFPTCGFVNNEYPLKLPLLPALRLNLFRLCFRTVYVASTTGIAMIFPYFNQVLGVLGALNFWPLSIYFPVEMYIVQKNIGAWTKKWVVFRTFSILCLIVTMFTLVGSFEGLITAKLS
ncbi:hypothetical protein F0562_008654 [Nyssa sinensis]|uniref:Amino acid transporter transmembrane domain-containing protein n=1 Tax=Nyssa sinensis TaxID=561372 RepID=A0A5J5ACC7_9ASTE|nr:hypothetical protein F0562_008654 [Nyssa sinensis]